MFMASNLWYIKEKQSIRKIIEISKFSNNFIVKTIFYSLLMYTMCTSLESTSITHGRYVNLKQKQHIDDDQGFNERKI